MKKEYVLLIFPAVCAIFLLLCCGCGKKEEALQKKEVPKVEVPKVEAPKVEAPKVEAPKVEALKQDDSKQESSADNEEEEEQEQVSLDNLRQESKDIQKEIKYYELLLKRLRGARWHEGEAFVPLYNDNLLKVSHRNDEAHKLVLPFVFMAAKISKREDYITKTFQNTPEMTSTETKCGNCEGKGVLICEICKNLSDEEQKKCKPCGGTQSLKCIFCNGTGIRIKDPNYKLMAVRAWNRAVSFTKRRLKKAKKEYKAIQAKIMKAEGKEKEEEEEE